LDHVIVVNEQHLHRLLREYEDSPVTLTIISADDRGMARLDL